MPSATPEQLDRKVVPALVAMVLAVFVIANDITALAVALPDIERDFDAGVDTVQWVINAYALIFGVLIVTGGRLADLFGRRRVFLIGSTIFAVFSLIAGIAPNVVWLIVARAFMGVGGAMMWPAPSQRSRSRTGSPRLPRTRWRRSCARASAAACNGRSVWSRYLLSWECWSP